MLGFSRILVRGQKLQQGLRCFSSAEPLTLTTEENGIRRVVMNNVKQRNALSSQMMEALREDITRDLHDKSLRVIILSANGPVFCAGHNLKELVGTVERSEHAKIFGLCTELMETIQDIPIPVICQVDSLATAAGCQLVASCDIAVASERATFCTPGVNIGLFCSTPAVALARAVPRKTALDMLLTGKIIDAKDALANGLVSRVVDSAKLEAATSEIAQTIVDKSRSVIAIGKASFYRQVVKDRHSAYMDASDVMVQNMSMKDGKDGIKSFIGKRKPKWTHALD